MSEHLKTKIENMSYRELLFKWRFAPVGDPLFQGEVGELFKTIFRKRREEIGDAAAAQISKDIGW